MAVVLPLSSMSNTGLSGTNSPSYDYHSRTRESFSSGSSQASPPVSGHSMISPFPFESSLFSSRGISTVPEETVPTVHGDSTSELTYNVNDTTIVIMGLPRQVTDRELRSIFIFAKDFINVELVPDSPLDDERLPPPKRSAIARFRNFVSAQEAKDHINSKRGEIFEGEILQALMSIGQLQNFTSNRRNTTDNTSRPMFVTTSTPASLTSANNSGNKARLIPGVFLGSDVIVPAAGLIGTVPPSLANSSLSGLGASLGSLTGGTSLGSSTSDYSLGPSPEYITDAYSGLSARLSGSLGPSSGKALLMESEPETNDEYDTLLNDHSRYMYTSPSSMTMETNPGSLANMQKPRRSTNPASISTRFSNLSLNTNNLPPLSGSMMPSPATAMHPGTSSSITSPISIPLSGTPQSGSSGIVSPYQRVLPAANPADQNPPCNTLYVGNLPANTSEDELKALFSRQRGYKRLCFRTKANGPMCFVEFEDVAYATRALTELYGRGLSNSVKGGIRLSFSKNPLGVRSNQNASSIQSPTTPSGAAPGAGGIFSTALHAPPGLPHPGVTPPLSRSSMMDGNLPSQNISVSNSVSPRDPAFMNGPSGSVVYRESLLASPVNYSTVNSSSLNFTPTTSAPSSSSFANTVAPSNIPGFLVG